MSFKIVFQATLFSKSTISKMLLHSLPIASHYEIATFNTIKLNYGLYNIMYICIITELKWNLQNAVENSKTNIILSLTIFGMHY